MADYTNADVVDARIGAEKYFNLKKKQGISLVRRGELSKKDYYKRIREVGIKTKIIEPDEYPGVLPDELETVAELLFGIPAYMAGFAAGGPATGAVGFGGGSATGQVLFDTANKIFADEDEITKPGNQIAVDALKQFGVDATLSYGIDRVVVPVVKGGYKIVKGTPAAVVNKANNVFGKLKNMSTEEKKAYIKRFGGTSEEIKALNRKTLSDEGLTATKYQESVGAGGLGQTLTGLAKATSVVPGANISIPGISKGGVAAFKQQEDDLMLSLASKIDTETAKKLGVTIPKSAERDPLVRDRFARNAYGEYEKKELLMKTYDDAGNVVGNVLTKDKIPFHLVNNLDNLAASNRAQYQSLYKLGNKGLVDWNKPIAKGGLGQEVHFTLKDLPNPSLPNGEASGVLSAIKKLNQSLLVEGETGIAKELPSFLKKYAAPTTVPFKYTGKTAEKQTTLSVPTEITGESMAKLKQAISDEKQLGYYSKSSDSLKRHETLIAHYLPIIEREMMKTINITTPNIGRQFAKASKVYSDTRKLLDANGELISYSRTLDAKSYNAQVYDDILADWSKTTGVKDIPTFLGRGLEKNKPDASEVFSHYVKSAEGIEKLKYLMVGGVKDPKLKLQGEQEFANLMYSQVENLFDKTLITALKARGVFDTSKLLKSIGHGPEGKIADKQAFEKLLKETQNLPLIKKLNKTLKPEEQISHMQNITYDRVVGFAKAIDGFQPSPEISKFLIRRTALAMSSGARISNMLPLAGTGAAVAGTGLIGGVGGLVFTMGILNLFNAYMRLPVSKSLFAAVREGKKPVSEFINGMFNSPQGKKAIAASNMLGSILRYTGTGARQGTLVGMGQENPIMDAPDQNNYEYYRKVGR